MIRHTLRCATLGMLILTGLSAAVSRDAYAADPDAIVKQVKRALDKMETFSCSFQTEQVIRDPERKQGFSGKLFMTMKKPYRLRIDRADNLTVIDGKAVWTYLPKHNQVQISEYDQDKGEFPTPHAIFRQYADKRKAVLLGAEEVNGSMCDVISLETTNADQVKVTVWIDRKLLFPVQALEEAPLGNSARHVLSDVKLNPKLDDGLFTFTPPDGAAVVDLR